MSAPGGAALWRGGMRTSIRRLAPVSGFVKSSQIRRCVRAGAVAEMDEHLGTHVRGTATERGNFPWAHRTRESTEFIDPDWIVDTARKPNLSIVVIGRSLGRLPQDGHRQPLASANLRRETTSTAQTATTSGSTCGCPTGHPPHTTSPDRLRRTRPRRRPGRQRHRPRARRRGPSHRTAALRTPRRRHRTRPMGDPLHPAPCSRLHPATTGQRLTRQGNGAESAVTRAG